MPYSDTEKRKNSLSFNDYFFGSLYKKPTIFVLVVVPPNMIIPYFSDIRAKILEKLDEAKHEILVAVYWFTNHELFNKLCEKVKDGKKVKLIIHNDYINNRSTVLDFQHFIKLEGELYFPLLTNQCTINFV